MPTILVQNRGEGAIEAVPRGDPRRPAFLTTSRKITVGVPEVSSYPRSGSLPVGRAGPRRSRRRGGGAAADPLTKFAMPIGYASWGSHRPRAASRSGLRALKSTSSISGLRPPLRSPRWGEEASRLWLTPSLGISNT